ncbi:unnamed protein product [Alternaria alternata]
MPLEDTLQALTISNVNTPIARPKIGRSQIPKRQEETRTSFMFPELHQRIAEAVSPAITSTWFNNDEKARPENDQKHITCVMGKFTCVNNGCRKNGWSSKVVAIKIRRYARSGYNATVYNQHCKACGWLGRLTLDEESYVERITYRLKIFDRPVVAPSPALAPPGQRVAVIDAPPKHLRYCASGGLANCQEDFNSKVSS